MEEKEKEIEELQNEIESYKTAWLKNFEETESLKAELALYKKLCKAQGEVICLK